MTFVMITLDDTIPAWIMHITLPRVLSLKIASDLRYALRNFVKGDVSGIAFISQRERKNVNFTVPLPDAGDGLRHILGME